MSGTGLTIRRVGIVALLFAATWLLWSGHYSLLLLALGALSCAGVTWLAVRCSFFSKDAYSLHLIPRLPRFWGWLLMEIVKSNFAVAKVVLDPRLPISPRIVTVDVRGLPAVTQATFANAISLTPGTLSIDVNLDRVEVHCLTRASASDLESGKMLRRARKLDGG